ncbi:MAG: LysR family transcriptional regulator [Oscillospiraceae bacterium]|nr:LysR family transcriptional regulator [Oscillospiraceae bacterium]
MLKCDSKIILCDEHGLKVFGEGPLKLLLNVKECGSLNGAAKKMYMSYKKALSLVEKAEEGLGFPLLVSKAGGNRGGGSELTPETEEFLELYAKFSADAKERVRACYEEYFSRSDGRSIS